MTSTARVVVDEEYSIAEIDPRIYGSFVEHMGRCVYDGLYSPDHPTADADGFRGDVADVVRELGPTILRYPGGNFVSGYDWEDGVGPREDRPERLDLAWRSFESNQVGTDEFLRWCGRVGIEPMMAVNLGSRGIREAVDLLEYCNGRGGTPASDLRRRNGQADPYGVRTWCLGNEMDGPWQIGHKSAEDYGKLAAQTAVAMKRADPGIELVACGTSKPVMPTFATWEAQMLEHCYRHVDYVSMHMYVDPDLYPDTASLLAAGVEIDDYIAAVTASVDYARAAGRHSKPMPLSFDEWNVWYNSRPRDLGDWPHAPRLIEDTYTLADALVLGSFLTSILRASDRVRMACLAQLVNVIAPIRTEPGGGQVWRQPTFYPFALTARYGRGTALRPAVTCPRLSTAAHDDVPQLDVAATRSEDEMVVFVVNRSLAEAASLELDVRVRGHRPGRVEHTVLAGPDPAAVNGPDAPDAVVPVVRDAVALRPGEASVELPPASWSMLRLLP
ncbi:alpha-N-arabinofuranosidase [Ruania suaedae]|uniref:arabinosylfuranosidase ArfA n=1 Tax=Ruania suaedae TaxID=2897774 RepID=UPI001E3EBA7D|nr:alpha-N-arabinofuranosidase [Ruania suaedae]UFU02885.1 alpha-N-arabinofuranosidase [Ruania suaedae]